MPRRRSARRAAEMILALALSVVAMIVIVTVRYLAVSGALRLADEAPSAAPVRRPRGAGPQRNPVVAVGRHDLRHPRRRARLGLAGAGLDAGSIPTSRDYPLWWLPASVLVYLFLHDSWFYWTHRLMHVPRALQAHARGPSRQPRADRLGGDELPSRGNRSPARSSSPRSSSPSRSITARCCSSSP